MNWNLITLVLFIFVVFFMIAITLLLYIRHWASRHIDSKALYQNEGIYFKHFIPEPLRKDYDNKSSRSGNSTAIKDRSLWAKLTSAIIILTVVALPVYSLYENRYLFLQSIDLDTAEISQLDYTQHQWQRVIDTKLPDLDSVLASVKRKTFIIPYSDKDAEWLVNGINLRHFALNHWNHFAKQNGFTTLPCRWKKLTQCQAKHRNSIILVLPGFWDFTALDEALANGTSIVAYGPPAQTFSSAKDKEIKWHEITFKEVLKKESGEIILRGDQLLTLGFDAGLILKAYSPFTSFIALSKFPQALSIGSSLEVGGENETRLYAKNLGSGRLVWMEFSPHPSDNNPEINVVHLNALMASIFRYLFRQPFSSIATWPFAKPFAAILEEDTEDLFVNAKAVLALAEEKDFPISWFILSNEALKYRWLTRKMANVGEIACHGDNHGVFTKSSRQEQVVRIARCQKVLEKITGIKPLAFRPPEEQHTSATIDAIINNNMTHYIANYSPDRAVPEIQYSLTNKKTLVSIPRMVSDDYEMWSTRQLNKMDSIILVNDQVEWMNHIGGLYMYSFHSQFMGNIDNLKVIEHMVDKLKQSDAYFETSKNIADWWQFRTALQQGNSNNTDSAEKFSQFNPMILSVDATGQLTIQPYPTNNNE